MYHGGSINTKCSDSAVTELFLVNCIQFSIWKRSFFFSITVIRGKKKRQGKKFCSLIENNDDVVNSVALTGLQLKILVTVYKGDMLRHIVPTRINTTHIQ